MSKTTEQAAEETYPYVTDIGVTKGAREYFNRHTNTLREAFVKGSDSKEQQLKSTITALQAENDTLSALVPVWVHTPELPTKTDYYLVTVAMAGEESFVDLVTYNTDYKKFRPYNDYIIAWMPRPLPSPPINQEK